MFNSLFRNHKKVNLSNKIFCHTWQIFLELVQFILNTVKIAKEINDKFYS
ncbi:hypothetical protein GM3709_1389 [Geminocystis sp. NIES-3709]|nr:hypothetical protein GM3709_1389 [Geminocystis sp. NIES-3709]